jgi:hypothetical protein
MFKKVMKDLWLARISLIKDQGAVKCLPSLHAKYDIVSEDKASNNIVFVCKSYYYGCLNLGP